MSNKETFDQRIKELLIKHHNKYDENSFYKNDYENYFKDEIFKGFVSELKKDKIASEGYAKGNGGELKKHKGTPAKMASVASSSRFIYLLFKDRKALSEFTTDHGEFYYEAKGNITLSKYRNTTPNYDGYFKGSKNIIYFEAKCHEVFDSHYAEWGIKYEKLFNRFPFIKKYIVPFKETRKYKSYQAFKAKHPDKLSQRKRYEFLSDQDYIQLSLKGFGLNLKDKEKLYFDVKQLVCHLLGMAERENKEDIKAKLIYLYYCPNSIKKDEPFTSIYNNLEEQFKNIRKSEIIKNLLDMANATLEFRYSSNETMELPPRISKSI